MPKNILIAKSGKFKVTPGHFHVDPGDTIRWRALGTRAHIFFPKAGLFECRTVDLEPGEHRDLVLNPKAEAGIYPYSVFCDEPNEFAEGGSDPELIICI
jgi:plastocyanin